MSHKSIQLAQNCFRSPRLVASMVADAGFGRKDVVYEIGPGRGIITRELARVCGKVIAVEIDPALVAQLRARFQGVNNVVVCHANFLNYEIRRKDYAVFANIPYNRTARIMKMLLQRRNPPREAWLVMQKEAARKFSGTPRESEWSVLAKPWFSMEIVRHFRRTDFDPVPGVDSVLLRVSRRDQPLVSPRHARLYEQFVRYGFGRWRANLRQNFKEVFTHRQWKRLAKDGGFPVNALPTDLSFEQWLAIFRFFLSINRKG